MRKIDIEMAEEKMAMLLLRLETEAEKDLPEQLEKQRKILAETKCANPEIGALLDDLSIPFLIESLRLKEGTFRRLYPEFNLNEAERKQLAEEIAVHCRECRHCSLKQDFDAIEQNRADQIFETRRKAFGEILVKTASG